MSGFCHEIDENCAVGYSEMSIRDYHYLPRRAQFSTVNVVLIFGKFNTLD
jgi:hypothetical protein